MENVIVSVKVLTGAFVFLIVVLISALLYINPATMLIAGLITYLLFTVLGRVFAMLLDRVNYEVTDIDRDKAGEKKHTEVHLGRLVDIKQSAEKPFR